jgi:hypothetical protein
MSIGATRVQPVGHPSRIWAGALHPAGAQAASDSCAHSRRTGAKDLLGCALAYQHEIGRYVLEGSPSQGVVVGYPFTVVRTGSSEPFA